MVRFQRSSANALFPESCADHGIFSLPCIYASRVRTSVQGLLTTLRRHDAEKFQGHINSERKKKKKIRAYLRTTSHKEGIYNYLYFMMSQKQKQQNFR